MVASFRESFDFIDEGRKSGGHMPAAYLKIHTSGT